MHERRRAGRAQKVTVALEDDLDGGPAGERLRLGIGGTEYEIDLSAKERHGVPPAAPVAAVRSRAAAAGRGR
jgi:Lsr2 protein